MVVNMAKSTRPRGPYAGTAERRDTVIKTAWEVFALQGFRGGSLREIAKRVNLSQAGVLHHFGSKEGLLLEVLNYREELNSPSPNTVHGIGILDHLRTVVTTNIETPGAVRLYVTVSAEATDPDHPAHEFFVERYKKTVDVIASQLVLARMDGKLSPDLDPRMAAEEMIAFLDGIQLQWLLNPAFDMLAAYDRYVANLQARYQTSVDSQI